MQLLGQHLLLDCYQCSSTILDDIQQVEHILTDIARQLGYTIVTTSFHKFAPQGVSGVVVIQESHISLHTWPEFHYAAVDIFTCGANMNVDLARSLLQKALQAQEVDVQHVERGSRPKIDALMKMKKN